MMRLRPNIQQRPTQGGPPPSDYPADALGCLLLLVVAALVFGVGYAVGWTAHSM